MSGSDSKEVRSQDEYRRMLQALGGKHPHEIRNWDRDVVGEASPDNRRGGGDPLGQTAAEVVDSYFPEDARSKSHLAGEDHKTDIERLEFLMDISPEVPARYRGAFRRHVDNDLHLSNSIGGRFRKELSRIAESIMSAVSRSFGGGGDGGVVGFIKDDLTPPDDDE